MSGTAKYAGRAGRKWRKVVTYFKENMPWVCSECGEDIPFDVDHQKDPRGYTLDHIYPLVRVLAEGLDPYDISNLTPMHRRCNSSKGKTVDGEPGDVHQVLVSRQW